ncbi:ABC1 kinase family protein [Colwellia psychrerythraea]|uniref:ABC-1 domain-containing protein n=1 Tax=Colwellia psychrerythraea TaxID=28229 RepID=A0A099K9S6_COLPS|nr:AarF/ABC1/UbiB kinase family protein [Colwellia psychrerythraea]KGJ86822.1 ABC-1 domain-containing protein [Colwellia psychrerythraea]
MPTSKKVPTSTLSRSVITGAAVTKIGLKHAGYKVRKAFSAKNANDTNAQTKNTEQSQQQHEEQIGELVFTVLSQLRGTAIKLSQLLSMETDILPETIRNKLKSACHEVPPINRALVRKQMVQELGNTPKQLFKEFDSEAFSAASIGQVHQALSFNNEKLAVKVQYPGIGATIDSDLKMLEKLFWLLAKTTKNMPKKQVFTLVLAEIKNRLSEEINYKNEARNLNWFGQEMKLNGIVIPKVNQQLSTTRILSMEMLNGQHLDKWLDNKPNQLQRNALGQKLFDFFWYSALTLKKIHADPHPGNFLVLGDEQLGVLDFGCVRSLSDDFVDSFTAMMPKIVDSYIFNKNKKALFTSYQALKFIDHSVDFNTFESKIFPDLQYYGQWLGQAYVSKTFDFTTKTPCPGKPDNVSGDAVKFLSGMYSEQPCFDRAHLGLMNLLTQIGANIVTDYSKFITAK